MRLLTIASSGIYGQSNMAQQSQFSGYSTDPLMVIAGDLRFCIENLNKVLVQNNGAIEFGGRTKEEYELWLNFELNRIKNL